MKKARVVFVPFPGMGHLVSTVEFAKLLINHDHRLWITVLVMKLPFDTATASYTRSLPSSSFSERVEFIDLPQLDIPIAPGSHPGFYMNTLIQNQKPHVREAVSHLVRSDPDSPQLAAFVLDMFCTNMNDVASEFGIPALVFFTSGAAFLGLMLHLHTLRERDNVDVAQFKHSHAELDIPSFANPVPSKVLPTTAIEKEWQPFFFKFAGLLKEAQGIIVNTFEELESHAVRSFSNGDLPVYPVGPILNLKGNLGDDENQGSADIIKWLDDQPPVSVIFLCFGSTGCFYEDQVREIARALEDSGARFLWSLRKPPPKDSTAMMPSDYDRHDLEAVLPEGFLDRTAGIGRVVGWAPQAQVLAHRATGGFVSHCGWNSTLESVYFGVPIATWPLRAEQQANAFQLVSELKVAVEISLDYRAELKAGSNAVLSADKIERGIRSVLEKDSEIRSKVKEMSEKSRKTLMEGGSSHFHLGRLIDYIMNKV